MGLRSTFPKPAGSSVDPHRWPQGRGMGILGAMSPSLLLGLLLGALVLAGLVYLLLAPRGGGSRTGAEGKTRAGGTARAPEASGSAGGPRPGHCSICGSILAPGQRMRSDILPGEGDRLMRVFGCPHCLPPGLPGKIQRHCPSCRSPLGEDDFALARYFERPGRRHVHILGCPHCRPVRPKESIHGRQ
jgi:hypothetical protein